MLNGSRKKWVMKLYLSEEVIDLLIVELAEKIKPKDVKKTRRKHHFLKLSSSTLNIIFLTVLNISESNTIMQ